MGYSFNKINFILIGVLILIVILRIYFAIYTTDRSGVEKYNKREVEIVLGLFVFERRKEEELKMIRILRY